MAPPRSEDRVHGRGADARAGIPRAASAPRDGRSARNLIPIDAMTPAPWRAAVLVADDDPLTRWALKRTLEAAHLDVTLATSRTEVKRLLDARHFHVAIVAYELGQDPMSDVLESFARRHQAQGLVVLYAGDSADEVRRTLPTATLVQKPFCLEAVTSAVTGYVEPSSEAC